MNADQLQAYFAKNKPVVLGTAAAGVVGLALLQRRKKGADSGAAPAAAPSGRPAGPVPAAAVLPSQSFGSTYDSSAYDVYNALNGRLEQMQQTLGGSTSKAPDPVASTLFGPAGTGKYVRYGQGIAEVESDGSLLMLTLPEWLAQEKQGATYTQVAATNDAAPKSWTTRGNLAAKAQTFGA